ncbi:MAG: pyridoxamine 5'-phosphate oxidase family protein [Acidimicrobiia bacterium]
MSRRDQIKMTDAEIEAFLDAGRDLQVASINADGTPHLVTMWYVVRDGDVAFGTYGKSQKVVNLKRDPRLTVLVATGDAYEELRGVSIAGAAEIIDDPDEVLSYGLQIFEKYWGGGADDELVRAGVQQQALKRVVLLVRADTVVTWDHSKLAGAY